MVMFKMLAFTVERLEVQRPDARGPVAEARHVQCFARGVKTLCVENGRFLDLAGGCSRYCPAVYALLTAAAVISTTLFPEAAFAEAGRAAQERLEAALREAAAASCPGREVRVDADLNRAALRYVRAVQSGLAHADGAELSFYASLEAIDPSPTGGVATIDQPAQADRAVGDLLPRSCHFTHAGVAAQVLADGHAVVAVLAAAREVELSPIAARVAPGASVRVEGRLSAPGLTAPRLYHLTPAGKVEETPLALQGGRFSLEVVLAQKGEHALELLADGPGGPEVIALRRVFAGVDAPSAPPAALPAPKGSGLAEVEAAIAQLRAQRGLPPVSRDAALDAVAAAHSAAMARAQTFAHVLKSDGSLSDRLLRARYASRFAGENIGLAPDAAGAHQAIEESPAHLMNLLDPRHTRLGLGAVAGITPDGERGVYLTEVLAQPIVGSKDPQRDIYEQISRARTQRRLPPLVRDPRLDALAQERVQEAAADGVSRLDKDIAGAALQSVEALRSASGEMLVVGAPEDVKMSKGAAERDWGVVGIGATYASSKQYGPDRLWILLLYAR